MLKIVVDTNIIVSALIKESIPRKILMLHILDNKVEFLLSKEILHEYRTVLFRPKFNKYFTEESIIVLLNYFKENFPVHTPIQHFNISKDSDDNKFIDLAFHTNADYLITGNINDFPIGKLLNFEVITASDYWNKFQSF